MVIQFFENGVPVTEPFSYEDCILAEEQLTEEEEDIIEHLEIGQEESLGSWTVRRIS